VDPRPVRRRPGDGYVWGRGAIDMKGMVAMEVQVMRRLARAARAAGRDPAADPIPGLRRDVIFCSTADEEAGGWQGADWLVDESPEWLRAAAALNEAGGISTTYGGVASTRSRSRRRASSSTRSTSRAAGATVPSRRRTTPRSWPPDRDAARGARAAAFDRGHRSFSWRGRSRTSRPERPAQGTHLEPGGPEPGAIDATLRDLCDPVLARTISAMIHDTVSVGIVTAGVKYNVIPGTAYIEIDCRTCPAPTSRRCARSCGAASARSLWARLEIECEQVGASVSAPLDSALYPILEQVLRDHDSGAVPLPFLAPFATDAKHLARLGVPTYGFSPLKTGRDDGCCS
jgi:acetylornithine deacetylase/succinyl-diaminopimelate desuccinylase-like protein